MVQWTAMGDGCVDLKTLFKSGVNSAKKLGANRNYFGFAREFLIWKKNFGRPIQLSVRMIILAFSPFQKRKAMLPFSVVDGKIPKSKAELSTQRIGKKFGLLQNIWEWAESPLGIIQRIHAIQMGNITPAYQFPPLIRSVQTIDRAVQKYEISLCFQWNIQDKSEYRTQKSSVRDHSDRLSGMSGQRYNALEHRSKNC